MFGSPTKTFAKFILQIIHEHLKPLCWRYFLYSHVMVKIAFGGPIPLLIEYWLRLASLDSSLKDCSDWGFSHQWVAENGKPEVELELSDYRRWEICRSAQLSRGISDCLLLDDTQSLVLWLLLTLCGGEELSDQFCLTCKLLNINLFMFLLLVISRSSSSSCRSGSRNVWG